jgi:hypothetical protein
MAELLNAAFRRLIVVRLGSMAELLNAAFRRLIVVRLGSMAELLNAAFRRLIVVRLGSMAELLNAAFRRLIVVRLAGDALEFVAEGGSLIRGEFDDEPAAAFQWYPHHDASPLLGCFQRTVAGPGLHRRHRVLPPHEPAAPPIDSSRR